MNKKEEFNHVITKFYNRNSLKDNIEDKYLNNFRNKFGKFLSQDALKNNIAIKNEILSIISEDYLYYSEEYTIKYLAKFYEKLMSHLKENELTIDDCQFTVILNKNTVKYNSSDFFTSLFMSINNIPNNLCKSFSKAVDFYYSDDPRDKTIEKYLCNEFKKILGGKRYLILIDDYSGTGQSIVDFLNAIQKYIKDLFIEIIIFCVHITEEAESNIKNSLIVSGLECNILYINKSSKYFKNKIELEKKFFTFERDIIGSSEKYILGYKNTQSLITNYRNTPNNTLSLFWFENDIWKPLFKRETINTSMLWYEKVKEIRWFLSYKKINDELRDVIVVLLLLKNSKNKKKDLFEIEIKKIIKYNNDILQECLENKYLTIKDGSYIITDTGSSLLEIKQVKNVSLKSILFEYKSKGLHLQKKNIMNGSII
ncbi:hypothetical protein KRP69_08505 [Mammaliicoccus sciuri]|uniref:phosphoribosyltransferase-like protein n=1 Tax=Mammaliicoccus sciuri TaxID=1296 RepID=UPI001D0CF64C|nr:hypothetical protein [Mammaliicoccus sciuri]MCC2089248.1 hypothetical protein [Mammaliicoccus sciuri]